MAADAGRLVGRATEPAHADLVGADVIRDVQAKSGQVVGELVGVEVGDPRFAQLPHPVGASLVRLAALRADRDNDAVLQALQSLREAAAGSENVLYPMKQALRLRATGGEVAHALREVWGTYVPRDAF